MFLPVGSATQAAQDIVDVSAPRGPLEEDEPGTVPSRVLDALAEAAAEDNAGDDGAADADGDAAAGAGDAGVPTAGAADVQEGESHSANCAGSGHAEDEFDDQADE